MPGFPEFTEADLRQLAGPRSFERGQDYLHAVTDLDVTTTGATATVRGSYDYAVLLDAEAGALTAGCSCPYGQAGNFCKHCVAVGLAVLGLGEDLPLVVEATRARKADFERWLESLSRDELLAELRALIDHDPDARRRLELRAALASVDVTQVRQVVTELVVPRDYISYQEAGQYAAGVREAAAAISSLAGAGAPGIATALAREAISLLSQTTGYLDESSGVAGDAAAELLAAHLDACLAGPPEPESLADYLATLLLHHDHALDLLSLDDYASLLGEPGFARLRDRITAAYAADPDDYRTAAGTTCGSRRNWTGRAAAATRSAGPSAVSAMLVIRTSGSPNTWPAGMPRPTVQTMCLPCAAPGSRRPARCGTISRSARQRSTPEPGLPNVNRRSACCLLMRPVHKGGAGRPGPSARF